MKKLIIEGNKKLSGSIKISGAKNSVVALIPAAMLTDGKCTIYNVPNISDVRLLIEMMKILGSDIKFEDDVLTIDNSHSHNGKITEEMLRARVEKGTINEEEFKFITGKDY